VVQRGSQSGQTFALREGANTIGRAPGNDVLLPEGSVSRRHARVVVQSEGVWIEDLGSTVGTFVNGQRVTDATWLRSGDKVQVGDAVTLGVRVAPGMAPHPAPPSRTRARGDAGAVRPAQRAAAPSKAPRRRRWIWVVVGAAALVVAIVAAGALGIRMLSETPEDVAMEKETPTDGGPVTEEEARQIVQDVVEHAFPQFAESDPSFYRAECEDKSFYRATYSADQTITDGDGNPVGLMEIVSISVDEETGEISVAASN
jgi:hypothetical protein